MGLQSLYSSCVARVACTLVALNLAACGVMAAAPTLDQAKQVARRILAETPGYQSGDFLSQADVEPVFNALIDLGWQPSENEDLYDNFLPTKAAIVQAFRSPQGKTFMRAAAKFPDAFDQLERLTWLKGGPAMLDGLIASEDGAKWLEYLASPAGAKELEKEFSSDPRGRNFLRPTGHIYTEAKLLDLLDSRYSPPFKKARRATLAE